MKWRESELRGLLILPILATYQQSTVDIFAYVKSLDKLLVQAKWKCQEKSMLGMTKKKNHLE